jgi:hypothetical protein
MEAFTFNTTELILLSATGVLLIIQLIYYLGLYNRIHTHCRKRRSTLRTGTASPICGDLCTKRIGKPTPQPAHDLETGLSGL